MHEWLCGVVGFFCMLHNCTNQNSYMQTMRSVKWRIVLFDWPIMEDISADVFVSLTGASPCHVFFFSAEKLSHAKEENLGMHQVLDQTLLELNSL